ncbi:hypothetical protein E2C01_090474 [Portunus trituberculatus]|uniref:Uncharacterized protein n=1 Tax=Portunus trituberculatus TaxID=210409 RepID=A0A5B7JLH2_PORTR|nr:hypothetical protein [Portunus trituberculatus]
MVVWHFFLENSFCITVWQKSASMIVELPPIGQLQNSCAQFEIVSGAQFENAVGPNRV